MPDGSPLQYFRDSRVHNIAGWVFVVFALSGIGAAIACALVRHYAPFSDMGEYLVLLGYAFTLAGGIGSVGNCLSCAGRVESVRGAGLGVLAFALGAMGFFAVVMVAGGR